MGKRIPARLTPAEGRRFGFTVGAAFLVLAVVAAWRGHGTLPIALGSGGALLLAAGLVVPGELGPVYRGWMRLALLMSRVTTPIIMGVIYFAVLTPIGLVWRVLGRRGLAPASVNGSYWVPKGPERRRSDLTHQF